MNAALVAHPECASDASELARIRLLEETKDPWVVVDWHALFFNYLIDPNILRGQIPPSFEPDLRHRRACMSLVALTMRNFRRHPRGPWYTRAFPWLNEQRFLNLRAYVRFHGEPGVLFLWGWLSRPAGLPIPDQPRGLACSFADINYLHKPKGGTVAGDVRGADGAFSYTATVSRDDFELCPPGSLSEFIMERYAGFFWHHGAASVFRAWHEPWRSLEVHPRVHNLSLVTHAFPWFAAAEPVETRLCAVSPNVWLGGPHRFPSRKKATHPRATAFFELP